MNLNLKKPPFLETLNFMELEASQFDILLHADEFRQKILQLIKQSKNRIYMTALYLQDDEAGQEILHAMYQAKQQNPDLDVKLFVDFSRAQRGLMGHAKSIGNVRLYRECHEQYQHKIDIYGVPVKTKEMFGVLHIKGFVFDDAVLYSGASLNDVYLQKSDKYRYDRYHLINHSKLADSFADFLSDILLSAGALQKLTDKDIPTKKALKPNIKQFKKILRAASYNFDAKESDGQSALTVTPLLGFGRSKNRLNQTIFEVVKNTQKAIRIFTPYFNFPGKINKALRRLLKDGKQVEIVVGDKRANDFYIPPTEPFNKVGIVPYVYETNLRAFVKKNQKFIDAGLLKVYLWYHNDNSFHLKGISSDNQYHLLTGHNINPRAWLLDLENGILIHDKQEQLKAKFEEEFQTILTHTTLVKNVSEIETISHYPDEARTLMRRVKGAKIDSILNRLL
ncbi:MAG: CDP-diacylglycerol--serine O-phosphatidyltransferase [Gammaproteobacteria bacterium]|nr:CDP-diacylglycerol--serine O-phosphatidyltransferase [Gammaproteobacteria bacterium]MDH5631295.1 CDP-diacylglycerol--serine O-phosphatidyltransferase [Gammaproteobacteria bacterium]